MKDMSLVWFSGFKKDSTLKKTFFKQLEKFVDGLNITGHYRVTVNVFFR